MPSVHYYWLFFAVPTIKALNTPTADFLMAANLTLIKPTKKSYKTIFNKQNKYMNYFEVVSNQILKKIVIF